MKVQALVLTLAAAVALSACGKKEEHVYAVDKVEEAQAAAMEKAPKAEPMTFDDHGQPKFGSTDAASTTATADAAQPEAAATEAKPADVAAEAKPEEAKK